MNRDEARKVFKSYELSYEDITKKDIRILSNMLETELINYLDYGGEHAQKMDMKVSSQLKKDASFANDKLEYAFIKIDGSYFKKREGISFNKSGFIGFGGEFSDVNVEPILKAFIKWCNKVSK